MDEVLEKLSEIAGRTHDRDVLDLVICVRKVALAQKRSAEFQTELANAVVSLAQQDVLEKLRRGDLN